MSPHDPFGRSDLPPAAASLQDRVQALLEVVDALERGRQVDPATVRWLAAGTRRFMFERVPLDVALGLRARRGSHRMPQRLIADEGQPGEPLARSRPAPDRCRGGDGGSGRVDPDAEGVRVCPRGAVAGRSRRRRDRPGARAAPLQGCLGGRLLEVRRHDLLSLDDAGLAGNIPGGVV
jgi:hypothetical protein